MYGGLRITKWCYKCGEATNQRAYKTGDYCEECGVQTNINKKSKYVFGCNTLIITFFVLLFLIILWWRFM